MNETNPAIYEMTADDLAAIVRYHGANEVLDSVLSVAIEAYGAESAVVKTHELLLRRAARMAEVAR